MSYDLAFWVGPHATTREAAERIYDQLTDGDLGIVPEDPRVARFYGALTTAYPDLTEENLHTSPWASPIYVTKECVVVTISGSHSTEVAPVAMAVAAENDLLTFDPQTGEVSGGSSA